MKSMFVVAALAILPVAAHAQIAPAPATAIAKPTIDSPIEAIAADPKGRAILDAAFPGMLAHESYAMFKGMSLKQVQPYAGDRIKDADIAKVAAELGKL